MNKKNLNKFQKELHLSDFFLQGMTFPSIMADPCSSIMRIAMNTIYIRINRDLDFILS